MTDLAGQHDTWDNGAMDLATFQSHGQDVGGSAETDVTPAAWSRPR